MRPCVWLPWVVRAHCTAPMCTVSDASRTCMNKWNVAICYINRTVLVVGVLLLRARRCLRVFVTLIMMTHWPVSGARLVPETLYNTSLKTYHDRILNKSVNCVIDKLVVLFFLLVSFAGKVCHGFWHQTTSECFRRQKQAPDNGQCVINLSLDICVPLPLLQKHVFCKILTTKFSVSIRFFWNRRVINWLLT